MSCHVYKGVSCHVKYLCSLRGTVSCGQSHSTAVVVGVVVGSLGGVGRCLMAQGCCCCCSCCCCSCCCCSCY